MAEDEWFDEDAGRVGRLYSMTRGRTTARNRLDVATLVIRSGSELGYRRNLEPEQLKIMELCERWLSVAEVAAHLEVPLMVARVQLSDLIDHELIRVTSPVNNRSTVSLEKLHTILDCLHAL